MKRNHFSFVIFIIGLGIFLYPWFTRGFNRIEENNAIDEYYGIVDELTPEFEEELIDEYENYNVILAGEETEENISGRLLGTIEIDKLNLKLPIY